MAPPPARFLVLRFSAIGDLLLTAPALAALRSACHGPCEIHLLVRAPYVEVATGFGPLVDTIHTFDRTTAEALPALKSLDFNYVIDLQGNVRSRRVCRALGVLTFRVNKMNWAKWLLVRGFRTPPIPHIVDRYTEAFAAFGAVPPAVWPTLFPPQTQTQTQTQTSICLGAAHPGKRIPPTTLRAVAEALVRGGHRVVLLGGPDDRDVAEFVADGLEVENRAGTTDIAGSAAVLRASEAVLVADTGMMHLAAAVGTRTVAVRGCTRPSLGMAAWQPAPGSVDLLPEGRSPHPCSKLGNRCRYGRPDGPEGCTHQVSPERILRALLSQTAP